MKNFQILAENVDIIPLTHAIMRQPELWDQNTLRTSHPQTPHTEINDIWIRFNDLEEFKRTENATSVLDQHESIWYPAIYTLPQARPIILDLMRRVEGIRLGRVIITKLAPGKRIAPHVDGGDHAEYYDRYHVILRGFPGSLFRCGGEEVSMRTGQVWWFNNGLEHEVINNSAEDRIHLIVDIRTR